jgi:Spy/CpxP family protein refolding chaperone
MRVTILAVVSSATLAFATAAFADAATTSVTPQPEEMAAPPISAAVIDDSKTIVCQHLVHEGQLMPEQSCLTKRQWQRVRLDNQKAVSDFQIHSYVAPIKQ